MKRLTAAILISLAVLFSVNTVVLAHKGHEADHKHPYPTAPFDLKKGKALYNKYCASCHGVKGDANTDTAKILNPKPTNFLDMKYMTMRSRVDHYEAIISGRPGTAMPPWKTLSEKDVWDLVAWIEHLFNHQSEKSHKAH